jgi:hypothetical protein
MGLDYRTVVMYGWKVSGRDKVHALIQELERYDEDYYDHMENVTVEDTMCGNYFYFGAKVVYQDATGDNTETIVTDELIKQKMEQWENYLKKYPKFQEILNYIGVDVDLTKPQMYVFQHIW